MKKHTLVLAALLLLVLAIPFLAFLNDRFCPLCFSFGHGRHSAGDYSAVSSLLTISTAQSDFRANDRDGNKISQFWRGDVAGLYALVPKGGGEAIKLIELSVAAADDRPLTDLSHFAVRAPKNGYWFRAIPHSDEDPKAPDPDRYAYCAYPDSPATGTHLFIVDERHTIYRVKASGRRGIDVFPTVEELKQWTRMD